MNLSQFNREIAEIRGDRVHGASELARRCLTILAEAAKILPATDGVEFRQYLLALAAELAMTRPSMAPVGHLLRRWRAGADEVLRGREKEMLRWVAEGLTDRQIAERTGITERTVNFHLNNAMGKLKVGNRTAAVRAVALGLLA